MTEAAQTTLGQKLAAAAAAVEAVGKEGENTQQKYRYARAEDVAKAAIKALTDQGLLHRFDVESMENTPITARSGGSGMICHIRGTLTVWDPSPEGDEQAERRLGGSLQVKVVGAGSDYPGDKAPYKAMTGARKYGFIHLLGMHIGDDPDEAPPAGPAEKGKQIGAKLAGQIVDRAWALGVKDKLPLMVAQVAGENPGDIGSKPKAKAMLARLYLPEAEKLEAILNRKADEQASK